VLGFLKAESIVHGDSIGVASAAGAVGTDRNVSNLSSERIGAMKNAAVRDQAAADAG
jgi:hypothetical protein